MSLRKLPRHAHTLDELPPNQPMFSLSDIPQLDWARMAFDAWAELITQCGAWTVAQITSVLTNWANVISSLGNLAWSYVTKTAENIMDTLVSWANMVSYWGNIAWSQITKTAADVMNTIATWANIIAEVGAMTYSQIQTALTSWAQICNASALGLIDFVSNIAAVSWSTFVGWITSGLSAITSAGVIATGAIDTLTQMATGFFTGASGLAKFAAGLFTADATGRAKFENLFVTTALINDLAVSTAKIGNAQITTAKIGNLQVTSAKINDLNAAKINAGYLSAARIEAGSLNANKITTGTITSGLALFAAAAIQEADIGNLQVTNAKIANAAITEAKIENLAVTNAKINDLDAVKITAGFLAAARIEAGTLEFTKVDGSFGQLAYYADNRWVFTGESLTGYTVGTSGSAAILTRRNYINLKTNTTAVSTADIRGYETVSANYEPSFKVKMKVVDFPDSDQPWIDLMVGAPISTYTRRFGFRFQKEAGYLYIRGTCADGSAVSITNIQLFTEGTTYILEARLLSDRVQFYIDGVFKTHILTNYPTDGVMYDIWARVRNGSAPTNIEIELYYFSAEEAWMD